VLAHHIVWQVRAHAGGVRALCFHGDRHFVSGGMDNLVRPGRAVSIH
jgi:hypothetical protein